MPHYNEFLYNASMIWIGIVVVYTIIGVISAIRYAYHHVEYFGGIIKLLFKIFIAYPLAIALVVYATSVMTYPLSLVYHFWDGYWYLVGISSTSIIGLSIVFLIVALYDDPDSALGRISIVLPLPTRIFGSFPGLYNSKKGEIIGEIVTRIIFYVTIFTNVILTILWLIMLVMKIRDVIQVYKTGKCINIPGVDNIKVKELFIED